MIIPDKHLNLDYSVISISAYILTQLKMGQEITYDFLLSKTIKHLGIDAKENYPYALSFLYLMDKIEYVNAQDSFIKK